MKGLGFLGGRGEGVRKANLDSENVLETILQPGQIVDGKYRVDHLLGQGGMAAVWAGTNEHTGKRVALKVILQSLASQRVARDLFDAEVLASSRVNHPNVVNVFDVIDHRGMACVVMEMLDGESLASYIARKGSLSVSEALGLLLPAMRGVAAANAQGVIHRDLKPQNIFICIEPDGRIVTTKVLDFGISVIVKEQVMDPSAGPAKVMGTLAYMSPENLLGEANIDARTDVYGCGVLFYEALTGQVPFPGEPGLALIDHVLNKPALPVAILRPDLSPGLVRIIEKAMAKERDHRYSDVNAMMSALEKELIPPASAPRLPTPHAGVPPHERLNDGSNNGQPPPHTDRQTRVVMPSPGRPALRGPRRLSSFRRWHKLLGASLAAALGFMVVLAFAHGARVQGGEAALVAPTTLPASQLVAPSAVKSARAAATVAPVAVSAPLATSPSQLAPIAQATGKDGHPANHPRAMRAPAATGHSRGSVGKPALRPQTQRRAWETDELPRPSSRAPTARVLTRSTEPRAGRIFTHDF